MSSSTIGRPTSRPGRHGAGVRDSLCAMFGPDLALSAGVDPGPPRSRLTSGPELAMFHAMRNRAGSETAILADVVALLRARLPGTWQVSEQREVFSPGRRRDAELQIAVPPDMAARLAVEIRLAPTPKSVGQVVAHLRSTGPD